jgi:transposase
MKPYSSQTSEKIVKIYEQGDTSILKVAARKDVSKGFVQKILKQKQTTGHVQPKKLSWRHSKCVTLAPD